MCVGTLIRISATRTRCSVGLRPCDCSCWTMLLAGHRPRKDSRVTIQTSWKTGVAMPEHTSALRPDARMAAQKRRKSRTAAQSTGRRSVRPELSRGCATRATGMRTTTTATRWSNCSPHAHHRACSRRWLCRASSRSGSNSRRTAVVNGVPAHAVPGTQRSDQARADREPSAARADGSELRVIAPPTGRRLDRVRERRSRRSAGARLRRGADRALRRLAGRLDHVEPRVVLVPARHAGRRQRHHRVLRPARLLPTRAPSSSATRVGHASHSAMPSGKPLRCPPSP